MSSDSKGLLKPFSNVDPRYGRIKKVFIAYIQNPDPYEQYIPPYTREQLRDPSTYRQALKEKTEHAINQQNKIQGHKATIRRFAECLSLAGVSVCYDQYYEGQQVTNLFKTCDEQIRDSDAVLLIVTKSLTHYMENDAPLSEDEILLTRHFLYNLITIKKPVGTSFIPVFINEPLNRSVIPTTVASSTCYSVYEPFDVQAGGLSDLYAFLTNQKTISMPASSTVIPIPSRKTPFSFAPKEKTQVLSPHQLQLYTELYQRNTPLPEQVIFQMISELVPHWKKLAKELSLAPRDIQECSNIAGFGGDKEACYQMILLWKNRQQRLATVAVMARALHAIECGHLLHYLA